MPSRVGEHAFSRASEQLFTVTSTISAIRTFDGLIATGAPLGLVEFNDVAYWPHFRQVLEWAKDHVTDAIWSVGPFRPHSNILYGIPKQTRTDTTAP